MSAADTTLMPGPNDHSPARPARGAGFTLVECVVCLSVMAVLASVLTPLLCRGLGAHRALRTDSEVRTALRRFARQLRTDARATTGVVCEPIPLNPTESVEGCRLILQNGHQVTYALVGDTMRRWERDHGELTSRETYQLFPAVRAAWTGGDFLRLELSFPWPAPGGKPRVLPLSARIGGDTVAGSKGPT